MSRFEALPDVDKVQAIQPRAPGLLVELILHIGSVLGEHVLPAAPHDHLLKGTRAISTLWFQDILRPQWPPPGEGVDAPQPEESWVQSTLPSWSLHFSSRGREHREPVGTVVWASGYNTGATDTCLLPGFLEAQHITPTRVAIMPSTERALCVGHQALQTHYLTQLHAKFTRKPVSPSSKRRNGCRNVISFPQGHTASKGQSGFEPRSWWPWGPAMSAEPRTEAPRARSELPTVSGRAPAGQGPQPGRSWGSPAGSLGQQWARAHVCVVTARLILPTACLRGRRAWDCLFSLGGHV